MPKKFNHTRIEGIAQSAHTTGEFINAVENMAARLQTKTEYLLAAMSFETRGTFSPSIQNQIGATGLIQFLKNTAIALGTTTDELKEMSAVEQLAFVEKYFKRFTGKLDTLEAVYTTVLSGAPRKPDDVLFIKDTPAYKLNPLDWNNDGRITAAEATTIVAARMFGGVRAVQQRLIDLKFVSANTQSAFADGHWGANTSKVLAAFQKSKLLPATGAMNEATGITLFPEIFTELKSKILENGDTGAAVRDLQNELASLGYLETAQIDGGFGRLTQSAVERFQTDFNLKATGKFSETEQKIIDEVQSGVGKGNKNISTVKAIQNRLVKNKYLTQAQANSGYGNFGLQTDSAILKFQRDNKLKETGTVDAKTFKILFNKNVVEKPFEIIARDGKFYTVAANILITERLQIKVERLAESYFQAIGEKLIVTSGYRPPARQALAMYNKIVFEGERATRDLYHDKAAIDEVLAAFRLNKGIPSIAVQTMTIVIENQMKRQPPVFISNHLLDNAVDVRKPTTDLDVLKRAAAKIGASVLVEGDHFHVELA